MTPVTIDAEYLIALKRQADWNGRVSTVVLFCLAAIVFLKVVIYVRTLGLLQSVRDLLIATRGFSHIAQAATVQAQADASKTQAAAQSVIGHMERAADAHPPPVSGRTPAH